MKMKAVSLSRLVIYARDVDEMARFYETYFGFRVLQLPGDRIVELVAQDGGANIMLHPATKSQKMGQVLVKLGFDVEDIEGFCRQARENGLDFGPVRKADGYVYANTKDPSQNSVSISSRAFRKVD
jgi:predicted enzyme related to lactoylglutathione lyase